MAQPENASLQLPRDIIDALVQKHISIAVADAFCDKSNLLEKIVSSVLFLKVDAKGNRSNYESDNKYTWIDVVISQQIKGAVELLLQEELSKHTDRIRSQLARQLSKQNSPLLKQFSEAFAGGIIEAAKDKYRIKVEVSADKG